MGVPLMAMSWELTRGGAGQAQEMVTVAEHWYLTEDKTRVVSEGHPDGRWLWASPGTQVPKADAIRYGALAEEPEPEAAVAEEPEPTPEPEPEVEPQADTAAEKKAPQVANKAAKKATNKAADKAEDK